MIFEDYHVHTNFCDGKNTPEEVVLSAIEKGMTLLGFSAHSYTWFDESYCLKKYKIREYILEIARLKVKYGDKIEIYCGIEQDFDSDYPVDEFDYVIGSIHYMEHEGKFYPIDESEEKFLHMVNECFGGDFNEMAKAYFEKEKALIKKFPVDIIGHFDLINKFNEGDRLFDTKNEKYVSYWKDAVDYLLKYDIPFEVNTGAISRGIRKTPYPDMDIIRYIRSRSGRLMLSSDSHSRDTLLYKFAEYERVLENEWI